jgi:hypothetical protein
MAIFEGEELVPVTTPDGRTLQLPRSLAAMSGQQIASPQAVPAPFGAQGVPAAPSEEAPPMPPPPDAQGAGIVEPGEPEVTPVKMMEPEVVTASPKRVQKMRKAQAAYEASPEGKLAAVQSTQDAATQAQADAVVEAADVEAATNDLVADAMVDRNADIAQRENDRLTAMQELAQERQAKVDEVAGYRKKIEDTKIDRTADHPVLLAIMAGLAGLGSGMKGEKVNTLDIINSAIDRKVAGQTADLDQMAKIYGMKKEDLELLKDKKANTLEFHNAMVTAETNKAIREIEELTAGQASAKTRANAKEIIAGLRVRAAEKEAEAVNWGLEYAQRDKHQKQQIGLGYAGLRQADKHFTENAQIRREEIAADMAKSLAATKAAGSTAEYKAHLERSKELRQFGVRGMDGEFFIGSKEGRAQMAQAAELMDEAAKLEADPKVMANPNAATRVQALRDKASIVRDNARREHAVLASNEGENVALSNLVSSGQSVVDLIDGIKALSIEAGRGFLKRSDAQVKLRSMFNQLKPGLKEAWALGAWDRGAASLIDTIIGMDPTSEWNAEALGTAVMQKMYEDRGAFRQGLDSIAEDLERRARNKLVNKGAKLGQGDKVLMRKNTPEVSGSSAKIMGSFSGSEREKDAENVGVVGKTARKIFYPLSPSHKEEAARAQSTKYLGMAKEQEAPFDERLEAYKKGDKRAGEDLVAVIADAARPDKEGGRIDLALPLLRALRDNAPTTLYQAARAALPKDSEADKQMVYEEKQQIGPANAPTPMLARQVLTSVDDQGQVKDVEGYRDLFVRAGKGDATAKQAIFEINQRSGHNKTLPRGSMVKGGR